MKVELIKVPEKLKAVFHIGLCALASNKGLEFGFILSPSY